MTFEKIDDWGVIDPYSWERKQIVEVAWRQGLIANDTIRMALLQILKNSLDYPNIVLSRGLLYAGNDKFLPIKKAMSTPAFIYLLETKVTEPKVVVRW